MNAKKSIKTAVLSVCLLGVAGCQTNNFEKMAELGGTEEVDVLAMDGGVLIVDSLLIEATVTGKQPEKRKVTLKSETGEVTIKTHPDMPNYDQVKVGDQVTVLLSEEIALFIGMDAPPSSDEAAGMVFAPDGEKPGAVISDTQQIAVAIVAIDAEARKVTFKLPDGSTKKVKVDEQVDLSEVFIGENLTVLAREVIAVNIEAAE